MSTHPHRVIILSRQCVMGSNPTVAYRFSLVKGGKNVTEVRIIIVNVRVLISICAPESRFLLAFLFAHYLRQLSPIVTRTPRTAHDRKCPLLLVEAISLRRWWVFWDFRLEDTWIHLSNVGFCDALCTLMNVTVSGLIVRCYVPLFCGFGGFI